MAFRDPHRRVRLPRSRWSSPRFVSCVVLAVAVVGLVAWVAIRLLAP